jgi:hypothetical protein
MFTSMYVSLIYVASLLNQILKKKNTCYVEIAPHAQHISITYSKFFI